MAYPVVPIEIVEAPVAPTVAEPKTRDRDPVADLSELDPVPGEVEPVTNLEYPIVEQRPFLSLIICDRGAVD